MRGRLRYYRRVFSAYLLPTTSQLTFWHEMPEENDHAEPDRLGEYYMTFAAKADYKGTYDPSGVPLLDYHGAIGLQYNPIAIAHYGLGNYNRYCRTGDQERLGRCVTAAEWLVTNLEQNGHGLWVWHHKFDWEYRSPLRAPWYSGLAQGQGISLLVRVHAATGEARYLEAARRAFPSLLASTQDGGVVHTDERGDPWIEEYIVEPPTHVLNGFIWATWGLHDYFLATGDPQAEDLFDRCMDTLARNLHSYDYRFWSVYEQSGTRLKMLASPFYHRLHIVQLRVLDRLRSREPFRYYAERWGAYSRSRPKRTAALIYKAVFKLLYY